MAGQQYFASLNHLLADRSNQSNSVASGGASHAAAGNSADRKTHATLWVTLLIGLLAALSAVWINLPLPWMMGPLLVVASLRMAGMPLWAAPLLRNCAHVVSALAANAACTPLHTGGASPAACNRIHRQGGRASGPRPAARRSA